MTQTITNQPDTGSIKDSSPGDQDTDRAGRARWIMVSALAAGALIAAIGLLASGTMDGSSEEMTPADLSNETRPADPFDQAEYARLQRAGMVAGPVAATSDQVFSDHARCERMRFAVPEVVVRECHERADGNVESP